MTHSGPTIPEAASSRSSVNDTLFLSKAESERTVEGGGGVVALGAELSPGRDRVFVERVGELGQRKIPGLSLTGWGLSDPAEKQMEDAQRGKKGILRMDRQSNEERQQHLGWAQSAERWDGKTVDTCRDRTAW